MKNKEKYDLNTLHAYLIPQPFKRRIFIIILKSDNSIIFSKEMTPSATVVSEYNAWLEQEYDSKILDDVEKVYLSAVIKPFKKDIKYIEKWFWVSSSEYIRICFQNNETLSFPKFKKGTMYKGMELNKRYTLEELGL